MKTFIETIDVGSRSAAVLECVDDKVLIVATTLTTATIFERLRREYGVPSTPWNTRKALRDRKQLTGESVGEYQRQLRVLVHEVFPDSSFADLETKILDIFLESVASDEVRREFARSTPATIKKALEYAQQEEAAFIAVPQRAPTDDSRQIRSQASTVSWCLRHEAVPNPRNWQPDCSMANGPSYGFPQPWQGFSQHWHGPPLNAAAWTGPLQPTSPLRGPPPPTQRGNWRQQRARQTTPIFFWNLFFGIYIFQRRYGTTCTK
ncbi:unnamed protein product [Dibothriocephalus latus]|uniref:Retrotransposon gag domain-containing protein n=1 Tax=Dibothriocephalus latus TaxID=60516 RepID=A0A3P7PLA0_DIBLA|nr:unnamed protein product [Dibothriocephalus latus]